MRIYEIALFLLAFNLFTSIVTGVGFFGDDLNFHQDQNSLVFLNKTRTTTQTNDQSFFSKFLNLLPIPDALDNTANLFGSLGDAMGNFVNVIRNTFFVGAFITNIGVDPIIGGSVDILILVVYVIGIVQLIRGTGFKGFA